MQLLLEALLFVFFGGVLVFKVMIPLARTAIGIIDTTMRRRGKTLDELREELRRDAEREEAFRIQQELDRRRFERAAILDQKLHGIFDPEESTTETVEKPAKKDGLIH
ncbi:MAG: hypothetical protein AAB463_01025 [Patescibacteria group bacterium]